MSLIFMAAFLTATLHNQVLNLFKFYSIDSWQQVNMTTYLARKENEANEIRLKVHKAMIEKSYFHLTLKFKSSR